MSKESAFLIEYLDTFGHRPVERYVRKCGSPYLGAALPPGISAGPSTNCYLDARLCLEAHPNGGFRYAEGFAVKRGSEEVSEHAWLLTPDTQVIDPTQPFSDWS